MNLFTGNSPYYHLTKYLLFLLKHPVYKQLSFSVFNYWMYLKVQFHLIKYLLFLLKHPVYIRICRLGLFIYCVYTPTRFMPNYFLYV